MEYGRGMSERWDDETWATFKGFVVGIVVLVILWVAMGGAGWS